MVNIMSSWYLESANHCSGNFKYGEDEMQFAGLTKLPSDLVKPPRVGEAAVQFECQVIFNCMCMRIISLLAPAIRPSEGTAHGVACFGSEYYL